MTCFPSRSKIWQPDEHNLEFTMSLCEVPNMEATKVMYYKSANPLSRIMDSLMLIAL